ncbi:MAG: hypothetical protein IKI66_07440 [Bacteroidales bacterium]|nr:hypothetical protein [Bacteroidales bacterium]
MNPIALRLVIQEPMTAATDILIAAVSFYAYFRLRRKWPSPRPHEQLYLLFFLIMGISTVFGAFLNHAFAYFFPPGNYNLLPNWLTNVLSVCCYPLAIAGRADQVRPLPSRKIWITATLVETAAVLALTIWKLSYLYGEIHIAICLYLLSLPLLIRIGKDGHWQEARPAIFAIALMSFIPVILVTKFHIGSFMIDFDISHVVIAIAMYLYYRAGLRWRSGNIIG